MSTKHTPGPWFVFDPEKPGATFGIDSKDGDAVVYYGESQNDGIRRKDDARLIAAAPDLVFQLLAAANYIDALGGDSKTYRTAIAKATGQKGGES